MFYGEVHIENYFTILAHIAICTEIVVTQREKIVVARQHQVPQHAEYIKTVIYILYRN